MRLQLLRNIAFQNTLQQSCWGGRKGVSKGCGQLDDVQEAASSYPYMAGEAAQRQLSHKQQTIAMQQQYDAAATGRLH